MPKQQQQQLETNSVSIEMNESINQSITILAKSYTLALPF